MMIKVRYLILVFCLSLFSSCGGGPKKIPFTVRFILIEPISEDLTEQFTQLVHQSLKCIETSKKDTFYFPEELVFQNFNDHQEFKVTLPPKTILGKYPSVASTIEKKINEKISGLNIPALVYTKSKLPLDTIAFKRYLLSQELRSVFHNFQDPLDFGNLNYESFKIGKHDSIFPQMEIEGTIRALRQELFNDSLMQEANGTIDIVVGFPFRKYNPSEEVPLEKEIPMVGDTISDGVVVKVRRETVKDQPKDLFDISPLSGVYYLSIGYFEGDSFSANYNATSHAKKELFGERADARVLNRKDGFCNVIIMSSRDVTYIREQFEFYWPRYSKTDGGMEILYCNDRLGLDPINP